MRAPPAPFVRPVRALLDLTARRRAGAALRESARQLRLERAVLEAALQQAPVGVSIAGAGPGAPTMINADAERRILAVRGRLRLDLPDGEPVPRPGPALPGPAPAERPPNEAERRTRDRAEIEAALALTDGRIFGPSGAAELLGLRPTTLASRIKAHGLVRS